MSNKFFKFKKFTIFHDRCAMKIGTDGVLLGASCSCPATAISSPAILDVGTGTGLIALMLAQRYPHAVIDAIDIDEATVEQAKDNVAQSEFAERITVELKDFCRQELFTHTYDLIVSNPPFYEEDTASPDKQRHSARHTDSLPFDTLTHNASQLLTPDGLFTVIIPSSRASAFILSCAMNGLFLSRRIDIKTTTKKEAKRCILEFSKRQMPTERITLSLRNASGEWSAEYKALTSEFYLDKAFV